MRLFAATCTAATLIAAVTAATIDAAPKSYKGYKVVRVSSDYRTGPTILKKLDGLALEPWKTPSAAGGFIDVAVSPNKFAAFESLGLDYSVLHDDLAQSVAIESAGSDASSKKRQADDLSWYDSYHSYDEHIQYFKDLQKLFPNNSEPFSTGTSYEGRDLYGLHLWGEGGPGKPAVIYHGTVHAREWITTMVVEYLTLQLIREYQADNVFFRYYLDNWDFYIFPIVNPDGFVYTQTQDRLWRKSRQPPPPGNATHPTNQSCIGVDINRNWAYGWQPDTGGSSSDPCKGDYAGTGPTSTPENKGLSALVDKLRDGPGIRHYVDFHSYGETILSPYGYDETRCSPEMGRWARTGAVVSGAVRDYANGTTYTFGPGGATLYKMAGASHDYVHEVGGARSSWLFELPARKFGFVVPPEQIRPIAEEAHVAQDMLLYLLDEVFFDGSGA